MDGVVMARKSIVEKEKSPKDALFEQALADFRMAEEAWADNRTKALDDIKFRAGDHWPEAIKTARSKIGQERPMLVVDKLNQYVRQVVNDARQNRPAVKIRPIDDEGDIEIAQAFQGVIRHIFERSNGDIAVDNATECAVVGGYGYYRVTTEYAHENTFNQEICVEKIGNPLAVMLGLPGEDPLKASFAFIVDEMPKKQFKAKYPNAKYTDFDTDATKYSDGWTNGENLRYCEYFYCEEVPTTMHLLDDGTTIDDEGYQEAVAQGLPVPAIVDTREIPQKRIKWCRLSGAEILEENDWLGKYIPIVRVVGNEYNIEGKVIYSGLIRAAKDPQRLYNYSRSAFAERVALTPKAPWLLSEGQVEGREEEWQKSNVEPAVLVYKAEDLNGHPTPPPQRVSSMDIPEGFARDMTLSEHDIQAAMGMYSASIGQAGNERSGKAIMARQREGDTATFHYQDNAARGIRDLGFILVDLIPKVYDSPRVIRILGEDGEASQAKIDPNQPKAVVRMGSMAIYNLNVGTYDVSVDAGPSFNTKRVEQSEAMMEMTRNSPEIMQIAGDLMVKAQDWPGAQELAERFRLMLPPPIQQALQAKEKSAMSPEAQAVVAQAEMAIQQRDQQIQEMGQAIQEAQQSVMKLELQVKSNAEKVQVEILRAEVEKFKAETDRMLAEAELSKTPEDTSQFDAVKLQYEDNWKKLDAEVKLAIAELQSQTTMKTAVMSANSAGDGSTEVDESGERKPSSAVAGLIESVQERMEMLVQGQAELADRITKVATAKRVIKRDAQGNPYSVTVQ